MNFSDDNNNNCDTKMCDVNGHGTDQSAYVNDVISLVSSSSSCPIPSPVSTLSSIRDAVSHLTRLDDFNVIKLSHGFFSQVTHHSTKKVMVLKMNKQAGNRGNALKETELLNKLNHENIVAFMGTVVHEGALHPLLEYINGGTLEKLIRCYHNSDQSQHSDPIHFLKIAKDIAQGMDYLHSQHYIHRDLTSKNVFIRKSLSDGEEPILAAVIGDFGFATIEPTPEQKLPTVGSPYWSSPECIKGQWYNHKSDVFSYGVICCELRWCIPADPDYLPRDRNFLIVFDKLPPSRDSLLARIAQLSCHANACLRPEFSEIIDIFESQTPQSPSKCKLRSLSQIERWMSFNGSETPEILENESGDIFEQHLIRRRNSRIERCQRSATIGSENQLRMINGAM